MSESNYTTVSIDNKNDFIAQVKETGVVIVGGDDEQDIELHTEGEGRATRYFVDGEKSKKADIEDAFEDFGAGAFAVPTQQSGEEHQYGDITCRVCGKELGYLTGSHMVSHADHLPQTVDEYRAKVASMDDIEPSEVPIAPDDLMGVFHESADVPESVRQELSEMNKARWEAGEYDHLRKEEEEPFPEAEPAIVRVDA